MFKFHSDKERYFKFQYLTSRDHIMPFIKDDVNLENRLKVLEIGCAEAGVLKAFTDDHHQCTGIELAGSRVELARHFLQEEVDKGLIRFIVKDIYDIDLAKDIGHTFDLIILKDVIEHIPNQEAFLRKVKEFLSPQGKIFFGFPPWQMPFGGHQQMFQSRILSILPYFHLLPRSIYKAIMKAFKEPEKTIKGMLEIKDTGISIERFERILKDEDYKILKRRYFLINPIYEYKFGLKTRNQLKLITKLPVLRNFVTTCVYYLVEK